MLAISLDMFCFMHHLQFGLQWAGNNEGPFHWKAPQLESCDEDKYKELVWKATSLI